MLCLFDRHDGSHRGNGPIPHHCATDRFSPALPLHAEEEGFPDALLEELGSVPKEEQLRKGMEIAARHIRFLKENKICDGVHVMAIGKEEIVPEILEMAGLTTS